MFAGVTVNNIQKGQGATGTLPFHMSTTFNMCYGS